MCAKKGDLPPFERFGGENAITLTQYATAEERRSHLRFGDIRVDSSGTSIILCNGEAMTPDGNPGYRIIHTDVTTKIENPVEFYTGVKFVDIVWLDPTAHRDLLWAAAGGRAVTTRRAGYNNTNRVYFVQCGDQRIRLSAETPEELLRD